jgi:hypothetical protein
VPPYLQVAKIIRSRIRWVTWLLAAPDSYALGANYWRHGRWDKPRKGWQGARFNGWRPVAVLLLFAAAATGTPASATPAPSIAWAVAAAVAAGAVFFAAVGRRSRRHMTSGSVGGPLTVALQPRLLPCPPDTRRSLPGEITSRVAR